jgi:hypothetical protein
VASLKSSRFMITEGPRPRLPYRDEEGRVTLCLVAESLAAVRSGRERAPTDVVAKLEKWEKHAIKVRSRCLVDHTQHQAARACAPPACALLTRAPACAQAMAHAPVSWKRRSDGSWSSSDGQMRKALAGAAPPPEPRPEPPPKPSSGGKLSRQEAMEALAKRMRQAQAGVAASSKATPAAAPAPAVVRQETAAGGKRQRSAIDKAAADSCESKSAGGKKAAARADVPGEEAEAEANAEDEEDEEDEDEDEEGDALDAMLSSCDQLASTLRSSLAPLLQSTPPPEAPTAEAPTADTAPEPAPEPAAKPAAVKHVAAKRTGGDGVAASQPRLLNSSLTMAPHQLVGLHWLRGLHEHGTSGILADEMARRSLTLSSTVTLSLNLTHTVCLTLNLTLTLTLSLCSSFTLTLTFTLSPSFTLSSTLPCPSSLAGAGQDGAGHLPSRLAARRGLRWAAPHRRPLLRPRELAARARALVPCAARAAIHRHGSRTLHHTRRRAQR